MTFWNLFFRILVRRPTPAMGALYWWATRRKVRASTRLRVAAADLPVAYELWQSTIEKPRDAEALVSTQASTAGDLRFTFVLYRGGGDADAAAAALRRTLQTLQRQTYACWEALIVDPDRHLSGIDAPGIEIVRDLSDAAAQAAGTFLVPVQWGTELSELTLLRFAEGAAKCSSAVALYSDEDVLAGGRRRSPWFKPKWNRELFLSLDYVSNAVAIRTEPARDLLATAAPPNDIDSLLLRLCAAGEERIVHIPHILFRRPAQGGIRNCGRSAAVDAAVAPLGGRAVPGPFGTTKVEWPLPKRLPLVSIIIPTRDKLELLRPCVQSVLQMTDYTRFEIIVVDNNSGDAETLRYLEQLETDSKVRVLRYPAAYNFSAINNFAAAQAGGNLLCLLNNDTEVIDASWLTEMARYAVRPEIGAVGAKLLYPDMSLQHAGVAIGIGGAAGHSHRHLKAEDPGYFRLPHATHYVSAVTAACLLVDARKFAEVGGLDEERLEVAFNDVDFCLKLQARGYRNVYVPHAVLVHHESKSRGSDAAPANIDRYRRELRVLQDRWGTQTVVDPVHNPNLDRASERFIVGL